jgi:hypothetical protein
MNGISFSTTTVKLRGLDLQIEKNDAWDDLSSFSSLEFS